MLRFRAYTCLVIFLLSTVGSYASVHFCNGEITDIAFISKANCACENEPSEPVCKMKCCKKEEKKEQQDKDCCGTEELMDLQDFNAKADVQLMALASVLLPNFSFFQLLPESKGGITDLAYLPPPDVGDILVDIQCFRI
jgi:hypothetical protein